MRGFFKEGDIVSGEVMQVNSSDGRIQIQTRNLKYGKLLNGFLLKLDSNFIRRMKNHIIEFFGESKPVVGAIVGTNGYVWIYAPTPNQQAKKEDVKIPVIQKVGKEQRELMAVLRNAMLCL